MSRRFAIYGSDGFAREVLPSLQNMVIAQDDEKADVVFVDDDPSKVGSRVHSRRVISFDDLRSEENRDRLVAVAIADGTIRRRVVDRCETEGLEFTAIVDASHTSRDNASVGAGSIFCAFTMVTGDASIGKHFHCNIYSYVAHDCRIGDYVTFAPRVSCNGRVEIDDFAYIGTGAVIKQGNHDSPLRIGKGAVIGMGAVVLTDVQDGEVVVGNPATVLRAANK